MRFEEFAYGFIATASTLALLIIVHYVWLSVMRPQKIVEGARSFEKSLRQKAYYGILFVAWIIFTSIGAEAFLFWIPENIGYENAEGEYFSIRYAIAVIIGFTSLGLLSHLEKSASRILEYDFLRKAHSEIEPMLMNPLALSYYIEKFEKSLADAKTPEDRRAYIYLQALAKQFDDKLSVFAERAEKTKNLERREESVEAQWNAAKRGGTVVDVERKGDSETGDKAVGMGSLGGDQIRESTMKIQLRSICNREIELITNKDNYKCISHLEDLRDGELHRVSSGLVAEIWGRLNRVADGLISIKEQDVKRGTKAPIALHEMFACCEGIEVTDSASVEAVYKGNSHGGALEFYGYREGKQVNYISVLRTKQSIAAFVESFFVAYELKKKGVFWHGLYGRDYKFLMEDSQLTNLVCDRLEELQANGELAKVPGPAGIRLSKVGRAFRISCLAAYPNKSIVDKAVLIDQGRIYVEPERTVIRDAVLVLY